MIFFFFFFFFKDTYLEARVFAAAIAASASEFIPHEERVTARSGSATESPSYTRVLTEEGTSLTVGKEKNKIKKVK